jgi:hypothetical protein
MNFITLSSPYQNTMIRPDLITLSYHPPLRGDDKDEEVKI